MSGPVLPLTAILRSEAKAADRAHPPVGPDSR